MTTTATTEGIFESLTAKDFPPEPGAIEKWEGFLAELKARGETINDRPVTDMTDCVQWFVTNLLNRGHKRAEFDEWRKELGIRKMSDGSPTRHSWQVIAWLSWQLGGNAMRNFNPNFK